MSDTRRQAAEEWVRERAQIEDRANWITVDTAHLAGQECGEQRANEKINELQTEILKLRADLLLCNEANKECLRELSEAIVDCKIVCYSYVHDGRPPQKTINRYLPKEQRR